MTLKNLLNLISLHTISANAKPIMYWRITVVTDKKLSLKKDSQNLGSSVKSLISVSYTHLRAHET